MTITLAIDDDAGMRALLRMILEAEGHRVLEAEDGRRALDLMSREAADLCIVDIFMPVKDGLETITELKALGSPCRILAISGGGSLGNMDYLYHALMFGADVVLRKPFSRDELLAAVGEALAGRREGVEVGGVSPRS